MKNKQAQLRNSRRRAGNIAQESQEAGEARDKEAWGQTGMKLKAGKGGSTREGSLRRERNVQGKIDPP